MNAASQYTKMPMQIYKVAFFQISFTPFDLFKIKGKKYERINGNIMWQNQS